MIATRTANPLEYEGSAASPNGIPVADIAAMSSVCRVRLADQSQSVCLLRWTFQKDGKAITCQIESNESSYDVSVVPHWDIASAVVEEADTPFGAFRRHAEIAIRLRQAGWAVARRSR